MKVRRRAYIYLEGETHPTPAKQDQHVPKMRTNLKPTETVVDGKTVVHQNRAELYSHSGAAEFTDTRMPKPEPGMICIAQDVSTEVLEKSGIKTKVVKATKNAPGVLKAVIPSELMPRSQGPVVFPGRRLLRHLRGMGLTADQTHIQLLPG